MKKLLAVLLACSACAGSAPRADRPPATGEEHLGGEVTLHADGGRLVLRPLLDNAVRVRFVRGDAPEGKRVVPTEASPPPAYRVTETEEAVAIEMARLGVRADRVTGALTFLDAADDVILREVPGPRDVEAATVQGEPTWDVAQRFESPAVERLYGTGQFRDGPLDVRDLPRRLTQVNTQIAVPMVVSSRGYGLLWSNYGLTDVNPASDPVPLAAARGAEAAVDVTTVEGTRREVRQDRDFTGRLTVPEAGRYAFFLDVGQAMARRWYVGIDGEPVVVANLWPPTTTRGFAELAAGEHEVRMTGVRDDQPALTFRPARDVTELRSPVAAGHGDAVTSAYRQLTGPAPMPPVWAPGCTRCRERYHTQEELLENAAAFRAGTLEDAAAHARQRFGVRPPVDARPR